MTVGMYFVAALLMSMLLLSLSMLGIFVISLLLECIDLYDYIRFGD